MMSSRLSLFAALLASATYVGTGGLAFADTVLTWWDYFDYTPEANKATNDLIAAYTASHPGITIKRTTIGFGDFRTKLIQAAAAGKLPDIAFVDQGDIPIFASQGALGDLTPYFNAWSDHSKYLPNVIRGAVYAGKTYGVPFRTNTTLLFYNKALLEHAGFKEPPKTWEEFRSAAKAATGDGKFGFCFSASADEEGTFTFLPFLWQAGGDIPAIGDDASVKALSFVNDFVNIDGSAPKSVLSWRQSDAGDQFLAGNCAMMVDGTWVIGPLEASKLPWAAANWPQDVKAAAPLGGESAVAGKGDHLQAAWDVIQWIGTPENIKDSYIVGLGLLPNREDTAADPRWAHSPTLKVAKDQLAVAMPRSVYGANYAQISEQIWTMEQKVLSQASSPEAAAKAAGAAIKPLLEK